MQCTPPQHRTTTFRLNASSTKNKAHGYLRIYPRMQMQSRSVKNKSPADYLHVIGPVNVHRPNQPGSNQPCKACPNPENHHAHTSTVDANLPLQTHSCSEVYGRLVHHYCNRPQKCIAAETTIRHSTQPVQLPTPHNSTPPALDGVVYLLCTVAQPHPRPSTMYETPPRHPVRTTGV